MRNFKLSSKIDKYYLEEFSKNVEEVKNNVFLIVPESKGEIIEIGKVIGINDNILEII